MSLTSGFGIVVSPDVYDHAAVHPDRAPMLDRVGQLGDEHCGSAVYLGKGWILTAYHAFQNCRSEVVYFAGDRYQLQAGRAVRLKNEKGSEAKGLTDLVMVPLETSPEMPLLTISKQVPFMEERVVMVGCGLTAEDETEGMTLTSTDPSQSREGHSISPPHWGENIVSDRGMNVGVEKQSYVTRAFATVKQSHWTPHNAQGARGDSGGGVFVKRGEDWHLSGIMLSVLHREDLGASATFHADLSVYREQIIKTIPEPGAVGLLMVAGFLSVARRRR